MTATIVLCAALTLPAALAQNAPPITLSVDARQAPRRMFHARLTIPAASGPLTLLYPKWLPGNHRPTGPINHLTGLRLTAAGKLLPWRRDLADMYAFHCEVPPGADGLQVDLDYVSPTDVWGRFDPVSTGQLAVLNWNLFLLYPQGRPASELTYAASLSLPAGWKFGTALPLARQSGDSVEFTPVSLTTLVDSPVIAGAFFRTVLLPVKGAPPQEIDMAGDSAAAIDISPQLIGHYDRLMAEAGALFGAYYYRGYHFLLALSDHQRSSGLEHHESSDDRAPERSLLDPDWRKLVAGLLPHELVHSWNGKYRRPVGLATPDYQQPMQGELLWAYEGLTEYLGEILTGRSGLLTPEQFREGLAEIAGSLSHRLGRTWRPLQDTAVAAQMLYEAPAEWASWRRGPDFYEESVLIWLEADVIIRQRSTGRRSLDDFCRLFEGGPGGPPQLKTYTFDDLVAALNQVQPYDWRKFFNDRLNSTAPFEPVGGVQGGGWLLVYTSEPNELIRAAEKKQHFQDLTYSVGMKIRYKEGGDTADGDILDVIPGMAAAQAGIAPGMKLLAVNGQQWTPQVLADALAAAASHHQPIELLIQNTGFYRTYRLDYQDGQHYPHLVRNSSVPDLLDQIIQPRTPAWASGQ